MQVELIWKFQKYPKQWMKMNPSQVTFRTLRMQTSNSWDKEEKGVIHTENSQNCFIFIKKQYEKTAEKGNLWNKKNFISKLQYYA